MVLISISARRNTLYFSLFSWKLNTSEDQRKTKLNRVFLYVSTKCSLSDGEKRKTQQSTPSSWISLLANLQSWGVVCHLERKNSQKMRKRNGCSTPRKLATKPYVKDRISNFWNRRISPTMHSLKRKRYISTPEILGIGLTFTSWWPASASEFVLRGGIHKSEKKDQWDNFKDLICDFG